MSTTLIPSSFTSAVVLKKQRLHYSRLDIRAQSFHNEGRWNNNLTDSKMMILKERIEAMRMKERLERDCRPCGWNYSSSYVRKTKKQPEYMQMIAMVCGTSGFSILTLTVFLCVFSVIAHLNL